MEFDSRQSPWRTGPEVDYGQLRLDLYRLTCIYLASKPMTTLYDDNGEHPIDDLRITFERLETGRILFQTAITIRNAWDQNPHGVDYWLERQDSSVGRLWADISKADYAIPLTFRESLNKIIHSIHLNYDFSENLPCPREKVYLLPTLFFYGEHFGKSWKAELDIFRFIECCVWVV
ncbi:hypothetical protein [Geothrix paludis]|uniref:hypothetical protein n=1 Tax=Geothrix paludis TaxID=2922722 RepID=UPI001FAE3B6B|nr:hypothetical protein [Geothrix paludis]